VNLQIAATAPWLKPPTGASTVVLQDFASPKVQGILPALHPMWNAGYFGLHELLLVVEVVSLIAFGLVAIRRRVFFSADVFGLGVGALFLGALLRFSSTAAGFLNPTRGQLVASMLLAYPLARLLELGVRRFPKSLTPALVLASALFLIGGLNLYVYVVGGSAPAATSLVGPEAQRFAISSAELATAEWLQEKLPPRSLVQTDRYGQLALLNAPGQYTYISEDVPTSTDFRSYIYASKANVVDGRGTGGLSGGQFISEYRFPAQYFDQHYLIVYSTGSTRVYH
jgi:hypothetical protein